MTHRKQIELTIIITYLFIYLNEHISLFIHTHVALLTLSCITSWPTECLLRRILTSSFPWLSSTNSAMTHLSPILLMEKILNNKSKVDKDKQKMFEHYVFILIIQIRNKYVQLFIHISYLHIFFAFICIFV